MSKEVHNHAANHMASLTEVKAACVMVCDISDFVKVVNRQMQLHGPKRGSEKTRLWFDHIFSTIVQIIEQSGGHVHQLIGDALVALFHQHDAPEALECAMQIKQSLGDTGHEPWPAQIKTSISAGEVDLYSVPIHAAKQSRLVLGQAFRRSLAGNKMANKHDVIVDEHLLALCTKPLTPWSFQTLDDSFQRVSLANGQRMSNTVQPNSEIRESQSSEIKLLTLMYLELAFAEDRKKTRNVLDDLFQAIDELATPVQASLSGVCETGQGVRFQFLLGSHKSESNEVHRAIAFAKDAQQILLKSSHVRFARASIGYGHCWQGEHVSAGNRFFSVHGREINLAARLLDTTPANHIYITESAYHQLNIKNALIDMGQMPVRGEDLEVRYFLVPQDYDPTGATYQQSHAALGRRAELQNIFQWLDMGGTSTQSCAIQIAGAAGVGKSTLVGAVQSQLKAMNNVCVEMRASPQTQAFPYALVYPILSSLAKVNGLDAFESWAQAELEDNPRLSPWLGLISVITPYRFAAHDDSSQVTPEFKSRIIFDMCTSLVRRMGEKQAVVIVIEDLQWFDSLSISLLEHMIRTGAVKRCIYTLRTGESSHKTSELQQRIRQACPQNHHALELQQFDLAQTAQFLGGYLNSDSVPDHVCNTVYTMSGGNLLLMNAFLQRLIQDQVIKIHTDRSPQIDHERLEQVSTIPISLEHAVQTRIDLLREPQRHTLKHCAIFKSPFSAIELLETFHYPDRILLHQTIADLLKERLLKISHIENDVEYFRFEHQLIEQCVYDRIPYEERKAMHARFASWLESKTVSRETKPSNARVIRLAAQYKLANQLDKAVPLAHAAVRYSLAIGALDEAMDRLDSLIEWQQNNLLTQTTNTEVAQWIENKARIYFAKGNLAQALVQFKMTLDQLGYPHPDETKANRIGVTKAFEDMYSKRLATRSANPTLRPGTTEEQCAIRVYVTIGELNFYMGTDYVGHLYLIKGAALTESLCVSGSDDVKAYVGCAVLAQILGRPDWQDYFRALTHESLEQITSTSQRYKALAYVGHRLGYLEYADAKLAKALAVSYSAIESAQKGHEYHIQMLSFSTVVLARVAQGQFIEALIAFAAYQKLVDKFSSAYFNLFHQYSVNNQKIYALAALGKLEEARSELERLEKVDKELDFPAPMKASLLRCRLMYLYMAKNWESAKAISLKLLDHLSDELCDKAYFFTCASLPLQVLLESEQQHGPLSTREKSAVDRLHNKLEELQRRFLLARPSYLVLTAHRLIHGAKDHGKARSMLEEALQLTKASGQQAEETKARNMLLALQTRQP
ncbi:MAG TPA: AAA family ATPase [Limnobacter sp.]|nr:AAA family ATPase [Limnobacter sp.]